MAPADREERMAKTLQIEHVFKVFGDQPERALELARKGMSKQEIVGLTGQSIGVFDASFTISADARSQVSV